MPGLSVLAPVKEGVLLHFTTASSQSRIRLYLSGGRALALPIIYPDQPSLSHTWGCLVHAPRQLSKAPAVLPLREATLSGLPLPPAQKA